MGTFTLAQSALTRPHGAIVVYKSHRDRNVYAKGLKPYHRWANSPSLPLSLLPVHSLPSPWTVAACKWH